METNCDPKCIKHYIYPEIIILSKCLINQAISVKPFFFTSFCSVSPSIIQLMSLQHSIWKFPYAVPKPQTKANAVIKSYKHIFSINTTACRSLSAKEFISQDLISITLQRTYRIKKNKRENWQGLWLNILKFQPVLINMNSLKGHFLL